MSGSAGRPNLLVLLLDSVPARRLGCYGYGRPTSPNLDRMAGEGVRFAEVISTGCQSPPTHASLFTALYPDRHGVLFKGDALPAGITTLAEILSREGYRTWCISNKLDVGAETSLDRGFDRVVEMRRRWPWPISSLHFRLMRRTTNLGGWVDDGAAATNRRLLRWFDRDAPASAPFFAFINYADAHYPYGAPRPYRFRFTEGEFPASRTRWLFNASSASEEYAQGEFHLVPDDHRALSDLFDGGVAYLDAKVGELLDGFRSRGALDRTLVVILADHGEFLGDRGLIGHGQGLYEPVLRVPLIMRLPGALPAGTIEKRPAQICDILPTVLDLLGVKWEGIEDVDGVGLCPAGGADPFHEDLVAFYPGQVMIRRGTLKYLKRQGGPDEVYDLDADPAETRNIATDRDDAVRSLKARLDAFLARRRPASLLPRAESTEGKPLYTLGINYYDHDSAVALSRDGRIVFAIAEERLSRVKKDWTFPSRAIQAALDYARIDYGEIDQVCFGWQRPGASYVHDLRCYLTGSLPFSSRYVLGSTRRFLRELSQWGGEKNLKRDFGPHPKPIRFVHHHYAHALSAFLLSGFPDASVLIVDGRGAWEATTMWRADGAGCSLIGYHAHPDSLGFLYAAFTQFLGFKPNSDEWKVMGLAPYGKPGVDLSRYVSLNGGGYRVASRPVLGRYFGDVRAIEADFGRRREPESDLTERDKAIAYAVQDACEEAMIVLARNLVAQTGLRRLCLAGGVAMNSKANGKILSDGLVDDIFVQPAATDDGTAIGAALAGVMLGGRSFPGYRLDDVYLGPEYSESEIESLLRTFKISFTRPADISVEAAVLLAAGRIVGWFQGRMEFGPRALGNRSILADPRDPGARDRVNAVVKFREAWRPFAPSVLAERAEEFFIGCKDSPFMILTFPVREPMKSVIPAVTHVDGSARVQTVKRDVNPRYHALIEHFGRITGVPVVMNTSFNLREEPIVCSPRDAIRTFYTSGLDALCLGPFLIVK